MTEAVLLQGSIIIPEGVDEIEQAMLVATSAWLFVGFGADSHRPLVKRTFRELSFLEQEQLYFHSMRRMRRLPHVGASELLAVGAAYMKLGRYGHWHPAAGRGCP